MEGDQRVPPLEERRDGLLGNALLDGIDQQDGVVMEKALVDECQAEDQGQQKKQQNNPGYRQIQVQAVVERVVKCANLHGINLPQGTAG